MMPGGGKGGSGQTGLDKALNGIVATMQTLEPMNMVLGQHGQGLLTDSRLNMQDKQAIAVAGDELHQRFMQLQQHSNQLMQQGGQGQGQQNAAGEQQLITMAEAFHKDIVA